MLLPLPCADFPSKLGMQKKKGAWNIQYNQCNLAAHREIAHNYCVQIKHAYDREYMGH